ncbi:MAG: MarR family transcriptional regulator [Clostridia bacterium]|nr:MarR family transcriptional regulator [Clostridia bacterium]
MTQEHVGKYIKCIGNETKRWLNDALAVDGITAPQAHILGFIHYNNTVTGQKVCQRDIEETLHVRASSVTGVLASMEKNGTVRRVSAENDARTKYVELTEYGEELALRGMARINEMERVMFNGFSEEERDVVCSFLKRILQNLKNDTEKNKILIYIK